MNHVMSCSFICFISMCNFYFKYLSILYISKRQGKWMIYISVRHTFTVSRQQKTWFCLT
jgi:hypothetical protein